MRWFLWRRPNGRFYACRHDRASGQVRRHALGTGHPDEAETAFHRFIVAHDERRNLAPDKVTVAAIVERYWLQHGQHLAGADVQRRALRYCVEGLGALTVAELTAQRQQVFVERMKARGLAESYIKRTLGALRAALGRAYRRGELAAVPYVITGDLKDSEPRSRVLELEELQALGRAVDDVPLARFLALLVGTAGRPGVVADLTPYQVDVLRRRVDLQPPGETATRKRNPILPICDALMPWVEEPRAPYVVERRMKALRAGWSAARSRAGLDRDVVPYTIRHTVATWLDEQAVPEGQIAQWLGHGKESTTRRWYIKRRVYRPDYLAAAAAAVDRLLKATMSEAEVVGATPASSVSH